MGTSYSFTGNIVITPPLNFTQIIEAKKVAMQVLRAGFDRRSATTDNVFEGYMPLKPITVTTEKITDEGILNIIQATHLAPSHPTDGSLSYDMATLLRALIKEFPDNQFHGTVIALCEDGMRAVKLHVQGKKGGPSTVQQTDGRTYIHWDDQSDNTPVSDLI